MGRGCREIAWLFYGGPSLENKDRERQYHKQKCDMHGYKNEDWKSTGNSLKTFYI